MPIPRLRHDSTALLVVDVQERLQASIHLGSDVAFNCGALVQVAEVLDLPTIVTEQYVKGLGHTVESIRTKLPSTVHVIEKTRFSALVPETLAILDRHAIASVLLCGVEAHVCVLQTALDLLATGRQVFLVTDAVSSGQRDQVQHAIARMEGAGAVRSGTLGATYELLGDAANPRFKACLSIVKQVRAVDHGR
ncbi:MAG: isochorismatase family protein [Phycisphaerae bacterium]|mgnify:CR=1 FL=1|nr:isochorismatase family protein [Phycisphaerae bacterium]